MQLPFKINRLPRTLLALLPCLLAPLGLAQTKPVLSAEDPPAPESVFIDRPTFGKDPFFPRSDRRGASTTAPIVSLSDIPDLVLKGVSGVRGKRLALINNYTLETGEETAMKIGKQIYNVKCLEIRERSVIINFKGQPRELHLRQGL